MFGLCREFDSLQPSWSSLELRYDPVDHSRIWPCSPGSPYRNRRSK
jgi:hypothetical protein